MTNNWNTVSPDKSYFYIFYHLGISGNRFSVFILRKYYSFTVTKDITNLILNIFKTRDFVYIIPTHIISINKKELSEGE